ncbi:unnamed protein product [Prorocentrum cordatum]|uniref:Pentacotripeptide-repeat region of PRORP domain-containing protein n=1 Tax=Prorocentrum cordatum TaxID=2364126 RepID=A0ABN9PQ18_9DINO|nr:unnamed protein product [Polarella glacialis]
MRQMSAVAVGAVAAPRAVRGERGGRRRRLQRRHQRLREGQAVAAGPVASQRDAGGEAGAHHLSYNAGISACEKGEQWQRALALLSEMRKAMLEPDVTCYNAGISACQKGEQWQQALALLSEMREARLEPDVTQTTTPGSARARRTSSGSELWRCCAKCGRRSWSPTFSYNAGISACEKGDQWQRALALLGEMREAKLEPDGISYSAGISACEKGEQWQRALALLSEMWEMKMKPDIIISSITTLGSARARRARSGSGRWRC